MSDKSGLSLQFLQRQIQAQLDAGGVVTIDNYEGPVPEYEVYKDGKFMAGWSWPEQAVWYYNWRRKTHPDNEWELRIT
jgi:hypothetical protein